MESLVLSCAPHRKTYTWVLRRLQQLLAVYDRGVIATWDRFELEEAVNGLAVKFGWNSTVARCVRTYLDATKCHPSMDPDGLYRSHYRHAVPRDLLDSHPSLRDHPVSLARFALTALRNDRADIELVVGMANQLFESTDRCNKMPQRTRRRCVRLLLENLRVLLRVTAPARLTDTVRARLSTPKHAAGLVAQIVAHQQRHCTQSSHLPTPSVSVLDRTLRAFNLFIRCGLFPEIVPEITPLSRSQVTSEIHALVNSDPQRYAALARFKQHPRRHLTDDVVLELRGHCHGLREVAIYELLRTLGLRAEAIECACLADVWCEQTSSLHETMHFLEKNSKVRRACPTEPLSSALVAYIQGTPELRRTSFLFPHPQRLHDRCRGLARNLMRTLCRRAYGPTEGGRYSPHLFRHWIVNHAKRQGRPMEVIARWLGHSHPSTTSKFYWTDDMILDLFEPPAPPAPHQQQQPPVCLDLDLDCDPMWA